jgi:RNA polymerase sigma-70 factor (sigma-E family)
MRDESFREFVLAATPSLSRAAYLLTGDHQLAEDLLQSALANAYRHWGRIRDGNPQGYVRKAMHHELVSWWRRRRVPEKPLDSLAEHAHARADPADGAVMRLSMAQVLAGLTPKQRAVIVLRFYEDLTESEAARVLGCSVGSVKRHAHDALGRLRRLAPHLLSSGSEQGVDEDVEVRR